MMAAAEPDTGQADRHNMDRDTKLTGLDERADTASSHTEPVVIERT